MIIPRVAGHRPIVMVESRRWMMTVAKWALGGKFDSVLALASLAALHRLR
jgi:hypothetical protein